MVRTYWLVQVFSEASWNLGLQPFAPSQPRRSLSPPCYVEHEF
jgi:hypothetical protein